MGADGTLRPRETLYTGREKSQGPHRSGRSPLQPASPMQGMSSEHLRPLISCPHPGLTHCGSAGGVTKVGEGVDRTPHLGPRSALLSRRSWLSLWSLETGNQARVRRRGDILRVELSHSRNSQRARTTAGRGQSGGKGNKTLAGNLGAKGQVESPAHHSPSSLWDHGDHPCLGLPET